MRSAFFSIPPMTAMTDAQKEARNVVLWRPLDTSWAESEEGFAVLPALWLGLVSRIVELPLV